MLRKYICLKNGLSNSNITAEQLNEFQKYVKAYQKTVSKTKKL